MQNSHTFILKTKLIYFPGLHQNQLYVQPSVQMKEKVKRAAQSNNLLTRSDIPRVTWKPYLNTGRFV